MQPMLALLLPTAALLLARPAAADLAPRIIGGIDVDQCADGKSPVPWVAQIFLSDSYLCTGVLVGEKRVLTAGHCCFSSDPEVYDVVLGDVNTAALNSDECEKTREDMKVSDVVPHPMWNPADPFEPFDVCILCLEEKSEITPLEIGEAADHAEVTTYGWGNTDRHLPSVLPTRLQKYDSKYLSRDECLKVTRWIAEDVPPQADCYYNAMTMSASFKDDGGPTVIVSGGTTKLVLTSQSGPAFVEDNFIGTEANPDGLPEYGVKSALPEVKDWIEAEDTCTCPPPPPSPPHYVMSDPHFRGLDGSSYDVTGLPGTVYSLVSDDGLAVNALFGTAYTTGVDAASGLPYRPKGTWMTAVGVVTPQGTLAVHADGTVAASPGLAVTNEWPRVSISVEAVDLDMTVVPPPVEWGIPAAEAANYTHINMAFGHLALGSRAHGLLGVTSRQAHRAAASTTSTGKDGEGVIEGHVAEYAVGGLTATGYKYSAYGTDAAKAAAAATVE